MFSTGLLAIPPEVADAGLWEKIWILFGSAALAKLSLTVIIVCALGFGVYYVMNKKT
jgi:hypothetical protein